MSSRLTFRPVAALVLLMALTQFALQIGLLARGTEYLATSLTIDDTYYYLQTAWNAKVLGFVTFDGFHSTNGVQFLWFVILFLLAWLVPTKAVLLVAALALTFALNGLCYLFILKLSQAARQPALALVLAGFWCLLSLPFHIYSMGMENSLHALVLWCALWQSLVFILRVRRHEPPNLWALTVILILNAWTRLDSALLSAVLFCFCVATLAYSFRRSLPQFWQKHGRLLAGSSLLAGLGLVLQLTAFRLMGDSFLPVSALIKTGGAGRGLSAQAASKLAEVFFLGLPSIGQSRLPGWSLALLAAMGILILLRALWAGAKHSEGLSALLELWSFLLVGEVAYHLYVAISGVEYRPYFVWYRSPSFIFWILTASLCALLVTTRAWSDAVAAALQWAPVAGGVVLFLAAAYLFTRHNNYTSTLYVQRYRTAVWIGQNYSPDTIFAAWNAGQLGFFSDRTFINLDGVINSVDYYERVLTGPVPLADYLAENDVAFLVDYSDYGSIPAYPIVQTFPIDDGTGRAIHIWAVSPPVASAR